MPFVAVRYQSAVIMVRDMAVSRRFYEGLLGQKVEMDFGPNVGFHGGFALWEEGHAWQILYQRTPESAEPLGRHNLELYFETDDLDAVLKDLSEAKVPLVHPLMEQPWGQRVVRVYDPDGHVVEVGEPMPVVITRYAAQGMEPEAIAQRTSMPQEIVRQVVAATTTD